MFFFLMSKFFLYFNDSNKVANLKKAKSILLQHNALSISSVFYVLQFNSISKIKISTYQLL